MTGWKYDFGRRPLDDGYGNKYEYTVREDGVPGYYSRVKGLDLVNTPITLLLTLILVTLPTLPTMRLMSSVYCSACLIVIFSLKRNAE